MSHYFNEEDGVVHLNQDRYYENLSLEELVEHARTVAGRYFQPQFVQLLTDARTLDASEVEIREALYSLIHKGGIVGQMKDFLERKGDRGYKYVEDEDEKPEYDKQEEMQGHHFDEEEDWFL